MENTSNMINYITHGTVHWIYVGGFVGCKGVEFFNIIITLSFFFVNSSTLQCMWGLPLQLLFYTYGVSKLARKPNVIAKLYSNYQIPPAGPFYTANVYRELRGTCRENLQYPWKRAVRITEKPYTPQRERLRILWRNPVIFTDCGEIL